MQIALIGCGGMGLRHVHGISELWAKKKTFQLAAVCDRHELTAQHVAAEAKRLMGFRPNVYTDFSEMLEKENLDALDIVTDTSTHHSFAIEALEADVNVMTEKPMGITMRACRRMMKTAATTGRTLAIAENYRFDPMNRLSKALIDAGAIGTPNFLIDISVGGGSELMHNTGWRALRARGGSFMLEQCVHISDLILYFMGDIDTVYATTDVFEKVRTRAAMNPRLAVFYGHRTEDEFAGVEQIEVDAEDTAFGVVRFKSGASGQISMSNASHGHGVGSSTIHGSEGTLILPGSRSGRSPVIKVEGRENSITGDDLLSLAPNWELDETTAMFWEGKRRMSSYDMEFEQIDRTLIALELQDFALSIESGNEPEVNGVTAMKALGLAYALLESGNSGKVLTMDEVIRGDVEVYQEEINAVNGL